MTRHAVELCRPPSGFLAAARLLNKDASSKQLLPAARGIFARIRMMRHDEWMNSKLELVLVVLGTLLAAAALGRTLAQGFL